MEIFEGQAPDPLKSLHKDPQELPPMPMPGEVDFICGGIYFLSLYLTIVFTSQLLGPPCQSFSRMNHHRVSFS